MKNLFLAKAGHPYLARFKWLLLSLIFLISCQKENSPPPAVIAGSTVSISNSNSSSQSAPVGRTLKTIYSATAPINLYNKSNLTINGDSINGGTIPCIQLVGCTNIHITHCRLQNTTSFGILISNCSNILVDSTDITKVGTGVLAVGCPNGGIRVQYNQILNTQGPFPQGAGIQYSNVGGTYNRIQYNKIQNLQGQSNPEDAISVYKSNGSAADLIYVIGNWISGGGPSTTGSGITLGDGGGSNQCAEQNIVINSGNMGMQVAGGTNIQILNNKIYSSPFAWSHQGLGCGNYSGLPSSNITISGNQVKWYSGKASDLSYYPGATSIEKDASYQAGTPTPIGWSTNVLGANINATLLPSSIVNFSLF